MGRGFCCGGGGSRGNGQPPLHFLTLFPLHPLLCAGGKSWQAFPSRSVSADGPPERMNELLRGQTPRPKAGVCRGPLPGGSSLGLHLYLFSGSGPSQSLVLWQVGPFQQPESPPWGDTPGVLVPTLHFLLFASAWVSGPELL